MTCYNRLSSLRNRENAMEFRSTADLMELWVAAENEVARYLHLGIIAGNQVLPGEHKEGMYD